MTSAPSPPTISHPLAGRETPDHLGADRYEPRRIGEPHDGRAKEARPSWLQHVPSRHADTRITGSARRSRRHSGRETARRTADPSLVRHLLRMRNRCRTKDDGPEGRRTGRTTAGGARKGERSEERSPFRLTACGPGLADSGCRGVQPGLVAPAAACVVGRRWPAVRRSGRSARRSCRDRHRRASRDGPLVAAPACASAAGPSR